MKAGPLRDVFEILAPADTVDVGGAVVAAPSLVETRRGEIVEPSGHEREVAAQTVARHTSRVRLRYFAGLTTRHRLRKIDADAPNGARTFEITDVSNPDGRKREHLLDVVEAL